MIHVDAASGTLCVGDERRRLSLDLDTGTAALELDTGPVTVRALRWREKVTLARYAALGPRFVEAQFLRACTGAEHGDGRDRELLLAVARWLNVPRDADALPFEAHDLARVTVEVCAGMGLRPAELDARPAVEVELLWQVLRGGPPAPAALPALDPVSDGWTRIVVRPDPVHDGAAPAPAAPAAPAVPVAPDALARPARARRDDDLPAQPAPPRGLRVRARAPATEFRREVRDVGDAERAPARIVPAVTPAASDGAQLVPVPSEAVPAAPAASTTQPAPGERRGTSAAAAQAPPPSSHAPRESVPPRRTATRPFTLARVASPTTPVEHAARPQPAPRAAPMPRAVQATATNAAATATDAGAQVAPASAAAPARTHALVSAFEPARSDANGDPRGYAAFAQQPENVVVRFAPADTTAPVPPSPWFPLPPLDEREREPAFDRGAALAVPPPSDGVARAEPAHDVDALVAALSERFEEAAAEIGIAPWD